MSTIEKAESTAPNQEIEGTQTAGETAAVPASKEKRTDPVRRITWIVLVVVVLLFVWYILADRLAPWTDQARVHAWIVPGKLVARILLISLATLYVVSALAVLDRFLFNAREVPQGQT